MKALSTAIYSKLSGSLLNDDISGRLYKQQPPDDVELPYAVYSIISDTPDNVFAKKGETVLIQFDLFSSASGSTEIEDMYAHLKTLYDDCSLSPTGETVFWFNRQNAMLTVDDTVTDMGTQHIWHYAVDYEVTIQYT